MADVRFHFPALECGLIYSHYNSISTFQFLPQIPHGAVCRLRAIRILSECLYQSSAFRGYQPLFIRGKVNTRAFITAALWFRQLGPAESDHKPLPLGPRSPNSCCDGHWFYLGLVPVTSAVVTRQSQAALLPVDLWCSVSWGVKAAGYHRNLLFITTPLCFLLVAVCYTLTTLMLVLSSFSPENL